MDDGKEGGRSTALDPDWVPRERSAVVCAFLLALGIRACLAVAAPVINTDGPLYLEQAGSILAGDLEGAMVHHSYAPVTAMLIALLARCGLSMETSGRLVPLLAGALAVFPLHALARAAFSRPVAIATVFLYAFAPVPARLSASVLTTGVFLFAWLLALALSAQLHARPRFGTALLAGAAVAAAYGTRVDGLLLLPFAFGAAILARGRGWRRRLCLACLTLVPAAAAAWAYAAFAHTGGGAPITNKFSEYQWGRLLEIGWPTRYVLGVLWEDLAEAVFVPLLPFLAVGLLMKSEGGARHLRRIGIVVVALWVVCLLRYASTTGGMSKRYTAPLAVLFLPWVAQGLLGITRAVARRAGGAELARVWPCAAAVVVACAVCVPKLARTHEGGRLLEKAAGLALRDLPLGRQPVLCGGNCIPFYAEAPAVPKGIALSRPYRAFRELERRGVRYIVKDRALENLAPEFVRALVPPHVTLVHRVKIEGAEGAVDIYRLMKRAEGGTNRAPSLPPRDAPAILGSGR